MVLLAPSLYLHTYTFCTVPFAQSLKPQINYFQIPTAETECLSGEILRKILWVSWTAKKTNEWVLNKAGVKRELLDTVKARK